MFKYLLGLSVLSLLVNVNYGQQKLKDQLLALPHVVSVKLLKVDDAFEYQYEVYFEQAIDHTKPDEGTFNQRVIVSHVDFNSPVVCVLEGYKIWAARSAELTQILQANQINIEHRFFKDSRPDSIPWSKLTIWQAATDQHQIIQALQSIYKNNWLTTGISKGGQVTMFHKVFYPHDVTVGVPYVAPLNMAREDQRLYNFFDVVGTEAEREKIHQLQIQCFEKQDSLEILLKQKALQKEWSFAFGYEKAVEYTILEYPFAFWQWGSVPFSEIPTGNIPADSLFNHLNKVADFTFFEDGSMEEMRPFFWAALTEIGMYGYNVEPFKQYLGDTTNYIFDFSAPNGLAPIYNNSTLNYVKQQLDRYGNNMIYIVGGLDPWGATAYNPTANTNAIRLTLKDGHHGTRLKHFSVQEKEEVYHLLEEWMNVSLKD